jgi:hypothetical protein
VTDRAAASLSDDAHTEHPLSALASMRANRWTGTFRVSCARPSGRLPAGTPSRPWPGRSRRVNRPSTGWLTMCWRRVIRHFACAAHVAAAMVATGWQRPRGFEPRRFRSSMVTACRHTRRTGGTGEICRRLGDRYIVQLFRASSQNVHPHFAHPGCFCWPLVSPSPCPLLSACRPEIRPSGPAGVTPAAFWRSRPPSWHHPLY